MKITKKLLNEFLDYSRNRNLNKSTIENYKRDMEEFLLFFHSQDRCLVEEIDIKIIEAYKSSLRKIKPSKNSIYYETN